MSLVYHNRVLYKLWWLRFSTHVQPALCTLRSTLRIYCTYYVDGQLIPLLMQFLFYRLMSGWCIYMYIYTHTCTFTNLFASKFLKSIDDKVRSVQKAFHTVHKASLCPPIHGGPHLVHTLVPADVSEGVHTRVQLCLLGLHLNESLHLWIYVWFPPTTAGTKRRHCTLSALEEIYRLMQYTRK